MLALLAGGGAAAAAHRSPQVAVPAPTGRYAVGTSSLELNDRSRNRALPVQLWYPTGATSGPRASYLPKPVALATATDLGTPAAPLEGVTVAAFTGAPVLAHRGGWPVVLFSPGYGESRQLYTGLVLDLASRGYVVVALDHPGQESVVIYPNGHTLLEPTLPRVVGGFDQLVQIRVADTRFVLDRLASLDRRGAFANALDLSRIGMFGHSMGGATAARALVTDSRIKAAADLDGSIGGLPSGTWSRPFLLLEAPTTLTTSTFCNLVSTGGRRRISCRQDVLDFVRHLVGPRLVFAFRGAKHLNFGDYDFLVPALAKGGVKVRSNVRRLVGTIDPVEALAAERAYLASFFGRFLQGRDNGLLERRTGPYRDVVPTPLP